MVGDRVSMLGMGLIGLFYTRSCTGSELRPRLRRLLALRGAGEGVLRRQRRAEWTTELEQAIAHPETGDGR